MSNSNYALVENGVVVNVVVWDGDTSTWTPPESTTAVLISDGQIAGIGYSYANGVFSPPV